jgi:hypothetical protein
MHVPAALDPIEVAAVEAVGVRLGQFLETAVEIVWR